MPWRKSLRGLAQTTIAHRPSQVPHGLPGKCAPVEIGPCRSVRGFQQVAPRCLDDPRIKIRFTDVIRDAVPQEAEVSYQGHRSGAIFSGQSSKTRGLEGRTLHEVLECVEEGHATIQDVTYFLADQRSRLLRLSVKDRREAASRVGAGRILHWLLASRTEFRKQDFDKELSDMLCWFLVPEELEDIVWQWIELECKALREQFPDTNQLQFSRQNIVPWTGHLAAGMVSAHLDWSSDGTANEALRALRLFHERLSSEGLTDYMSWLYAKLVIDRALKKDYSLPSDPGLFNWYLLTPLESHKYQSNADGVKRMKEDFFENLLYHPETPDPRLWQKTVRAFQQDPTNHPWSKIISGSARDHKCSSSVRAAHIFRMFGQEEPAKALDEFVTSTFSTPHFQTVLDRVRLRLGQDPKLRRFKDRVDAAGGPRDGLLEELAGKDPWHLAGRKFLNSSDGRRSSRKPRGRA